MFEQIHLEKENSEDSSDIPLIQRDLEIKEYTLSSYEEMPFIQDTDRQVRLTIHAMNSTLHKHHEVLTKTNLFQEEHITPEFVIEALHFEKCAADFVNSMISFIKYNTFINPQFGHVFIRFSSEKNMYPTDILINRRLTENDCPSDNLKKTNSSVALLKKISTVLGKESIPFSQEQIEKALRQEDTELLSLVKHSKIKKLVHQIYDLNQNDQTQKGRSILNYYLSDLDQNGYHFTTFEFKNIPTDKLEKVLKENTCNDKNLFEHLIEKTVSQKISDQKSLWKKNSFIRQLNCIAERLPHLFNRCIFIKTLGLYKDAQLLDLFLKHNPQKSINFMISNMYQDNQLNESEKEVVEKHWLKKTPNILKPIHRFILKHTQLRKFSPVFKENTKML